MTTRLIIVVARVSRPVKLIRKFVTASTGQETRATSENQPNLAQP